MAKRVTLDVIRDYDKFRYVLEFKQGNSMWTNFLSDEVYDDPRRLGAFLKSIVSEVQIKLGS